MKTQSASSPLHSILIVSACASLTCVLGSIHAFSVFIPSWESLTNAGRGGVSLIYSVSLISLTAMVLVGYRVYGRASPPILFLCSGSVAALGLFASAYSSSIMALYLFYGLIFGAANGLGYGYALQLSGQALPERRGFSMSLVTAFYAVGATGAPPLLVSLLTENGIRTALLFAAAVIIVVSTLAATLLWIVRTKYLSESTENYIALTGQQIRSRRLLWLGYGTAVTAGLMVISQAYNIALWKQSGVTGATWSTMLVAAGNMLGGFSAGLLLLRYSSIELIRLLPILGAIGLVAIITADDRLYALIGLACIGYSYGAVIAIYPVTVSDLFGSLASARVYGQIFTAWGIAGVLGPWISGLLYDISHSYQLALITASVLSSLSTILLYQLREPPNKSEIP